MKTIALVSCGSAKQTVVAPARLLYTSTLFRKAAAYAERRYPRRWFVLSALHGLVDPDALVAPYECTLATMTAEALVCGQLRVRGLLRCRIELHAGETYCAPLRGRLDVVEPLAGLGIGFRLNWYTVREKRAAGV